MQLSVNRVGGTIATLLVATSVGQAAIVAAWDFSDASEETAITTNAQVVAFDATAWNSNANAGRTPDVTQVSGVTVSNLTVGTTSTTARLRNAASATGNPGGKMMLGRIEGTNSTTVSNALANNDGFFFTITPGASSLDLTNVSFDFTSDGTSNRSAALFYKIGAGSYTQIGSSLSDNDSTWDNSFSESLAALPDLTSSTPITFALVGWIPVTGSTNVQTVSFDNIVVTGAVVPEPATLGLLAGATVLGLRRRR